jgi:hypothetical protein
MHFNFDFSTRQILWTLTFAGQLILLVVLLGRDRARRYPWFTAAAVLFALRLMAEILLSGRLAPLPLKETMLALADTGVIVSVLVVVEIARRSFAGAQRSLWIVNAAGMLVVSGCALYWWGPWPAAKGLDLDTLLGKLNLMQMVAQRGDALVNVLLVELGLLVVLFGRKFKASWRSHTQMIAIGLSTVGMGILALEGGVQFIARTAHPASKAEGDHILGLIYKLMNANEVVYLAALAWWIVWLWLDEPRTVEAPLVETTPEPAEEPLQGS